MYDFHVNIIFYVKTNAYNKFNTLIVKWSERLPFNTLIIHEYYILIHYIVHKFI
jgi:hypothetical protein